MVVEALTLTLTTWLVLTAFEGYLRPAQGRVGWLVRQAGWAVLACVSAHVVFALATLAAAGELPHWGQYVDYLRAFLVGDLGDVTYDFSTWSPGLAVGALQLCSATALVLLLRRAPRS